MIARFIRSTGSDTSDRERRLKGTKWHLFLSLRSKRPLCKLMPTRRPENRRGEGGGYRGFEYVEEPDRWSKAQQVSLSLLERTNWGCGRCRASYNRRLRQIQQRAARERPV